MPQWSLQKPLLDFLPQGAEHGAALPSGSPIASVGVALAMNPMLYVSERSIMAETGHRLHSVGGHWKMKQLCASQEAMAYHRGPESCCSSALSSRAALTFLKED